MRISGDVKGTPGALLVGPAGSLGAAAGHVRAMRHVHMNPTEMAYYGVKSGDQIAPAGRVPRAAPRF